MQFLVWLQKPYPVLETFFQKEVLACSFGLFIYLFLTLFQPFNIQDIASQESRYILGFGIVTTVFMSINYSFFPLLFPVWFHKESWTVGKALLFIIFNILCIAFGNYYYHIFSTGNDLYIFDLSSFLFMTTMVGIFPVLFFLFTTELLLSKQLIKEANTINKQLVIEQKNNSATSVIHSIQLQGKASTDCLNLDLQQFLFAQSEGNYSKIHYFKNDFLQTKLLRVSLKELEIQFKQYTEIIRCHRSFIVNKNHIASLSGNARSCNIHFINSNLTVPVSRSFSKEKLI
ncbi:MULTISPECIES: LytTR family DNA-binding domain-containing protein [unclassified Aureispira]|uniref:LytTR family DNA-binding domain-containing protein n=1 Tax=unclassified Aureispira TaxID=2649989 RepID=UPI000698A987|nr:MULTISPECIES: LytTR family DNA-binding domain-containing protein [unclassified Aureispira]WMX17448.1 LytTR family DNA-binding domain-containing protein [Aureispira sp. CCB-E]